MYDVLAQPLTRLRRSESANAGKPARVLLNRLRGFNRMAGAVINPTEKPAGWRGKRRPDGFADIDVFLKIRGPDP